MLIVIGIIVMITGIALSGQSTFTRTQSLNNLAYDITLTIRQAQSYGLASQITGGSINAGYGVAFDRATPSSYVLFADTYPAVPSGSLPDAKPGNGRYDAGNDIAIQTYIIGDDFSITDFCVSGPLCSTSLLSKLVVTFQRPNTEASIQGYVGSTWDTYQNACIRLQSANGGVRYISVSQTSQIQAGMQNISSVCP